MKRNVLNSPGLLELKKQRLKILRNKIIKYFIIFFIIFFILSFVSKLKQINIREIEIIGNKVIETEVIKKIIEEKISGKYLWLFPKTNLFFYPKNSIINELQDKYKRIETINLSIKNNKILEISLTERVAKYTWCGVMVNLIETEKKCYFLDEDGYIFDEAPYFSGNVYFKFFSLEDNHPMGSYFYKQNFKQLVLFKDILIDMNLKPVALNIINNDNVEIILSRGSSLVDSPKIIFKINDDVQNISENLQAALDNEPLKSKFKNKYSMLQYIDLRFGNKVYDKFLEKP